jgi:CelD/BcsL family acetyltransferase involved in cellulose biosynthesis
MRVDIAETTSALMQMGPEWRDLVDRCPQVSIFSTFEWAQAAFTTRRSAALPFVIKVYDGTRLVGVAPFCLVPSAGSSVLEHMASGGRGLSDYQEVISEPGLESAVLERVFGVLADTRAQWQALDLSELPVGLPVERLTRPAQAVDLLVLQLPASPCYTAGLAPSWEAQLKRFSGNLRETVERKRRKLLRELPARFVSVQDEEVLMNGLRAMHALQDRRWEPEAAPERAQYFDFVRVMAPAMLRRGWLDFRLLEVGGSYVAGSFAFIFKGTAFHYLTACDVSETWSRRSVGTLSTADAMRSAIDHGCHTFDMMRGEESYKATFLGARRQSQRLIFCSSIVALHYYRARGWVRGLQRRGERLYLQARRLIPSSPAVSPTTPVMIAGAPPEPARPMASPSVTNP